MNAQSMVKAVAGPPLSVDTWWMRKLCRATVEVILKNFDAEMLTGPPPTPANILSPGTDPKTGVLRVAQPGNLGENLPAAPNSPPGGTLLKPDSFGVTRACKVEHVRFTTRSENGK
jgi:hypothetical protein